MVLDFKKQIKELDALLLKADYGYLIVEDEKVFLQTESKKIELNEKHKIKVYKGDTLIEVSYHNVLTKKEISGGWPLFAGMDALVKE